MKIYVQERSLNEPLNDGKSKAFIVQLLLCLITLPQWSRSLFPGLVLLISAGK